jgi:ABC-2 type transport system ATP-binding protein
MVCASTSIHDSGGDESNMTMREEAKAAISIDRLSKTYPVPFLRLKKFLRRKFKPPVEALRNVSFRISEGEIFGLIGPNGAGKTTLTKTIATLIQPTSGTVAVKGYDSVADDQNVRRNVGLAGAEERSFYWRLTAEQNLMFFGRLHGLSSKNAKRRIAELVDLLELQEVSNRRFAELSTGNKQRMSVARAMFTNPPVLLLDEPTRSLDPIAAARMRSTIKSLTQTHGVTVFLTSHNLGEVEELCDRVAIISKGEIRAIDTPGNLRATHTEEEQVTIVFSGLNGVDAERALARSIGATFGVLNAGARPHEFVVKIKRSPDDEMLDRVLRVLQESGAVIKSVEHERASLLDVLESYESQSTEAE